MDLQKVLLMPHAKSSRAVPKSVTPPATAPQSLKTARAPKEATQRVRQTKEQRNLEKRMDALADIDDLLDNKPSKAKIRDYLLGRVSMLLEERGIC
jgi:hypothetical protein